MNTATPQEEWVLDEQNDEQVLDNQETPGLEQADVDEPTPHDDLAKELGWKPKSEWKGDQSKWTPADQYIRTAFQKQREAADRIKAANGATRRVTAERDDMAMRLERLEKTTGAMMAEQERNIRAQVKREYEAAKRQAAKAGDDERYEELDEELDTKLKQIDQHFEQRKPKAQPDVTQQAQAMLQDPIIGKFFRDHPWVAEHDDIYEFVYEVAEQHAQAGRTKEEQIFAVKRALREEYPEYYKQTQSRRGQEQRPSPTQQIGDDLDDEANAPARDPDTGQFVPRRDAHLYQQPQQRQQTRQPPQFQSGSRSVGARTPEQAAAAALPPEALRVFNEQKKAGRFTGDIVKFAKIYNGEVDNVLE